MEVAGFINFFLEDEILLSFIQEVEGRGERFWSSELRQRKEEKTQVEFVRVSILPVLCMWVTASALLLETVCLVS